jgi:hypothetical protein
MCQFTRFFIGAAIGSVVWMTSMWAAAQPMPQRGAEPRADAAEKFEPGCHAYEADCSMRPLENGKVGEMVRVCEKVQLICSERRGTTTVQHVR